VQEVIFKKIWQTFRAWLNKLANWGRKIDPIAEMQYECDKATEEIKNGRQGLEQHRGLIERVARQANAGVQHVADLKAKIQSYLDSGDRETAAKFALELQKAERDLAENQSQLKVHEQTYESNLLKIKFATKKISEVRGRIAEYDANLKMSKAEGEIAKLSQSLNFDVTTDFGQVEQMVQERIDENRAVVRVAADLSGNGLDEIRRSEDVEKKLAEDALKQFENRDKSTGHEVVV
jgi:phage shock protein A